MVIKPTQVTKNTVQAGVNVPHGTGNIPGVGNKLFRITSESAD